MSLVQQENKCGCDMPVFHPILTVRLVYRGSRVGSGGPVVWPAESPDLKHSDFFL